MSDQSNTKLLKQLTTRKRDPNAARDYQKSKADKESKKQAAEEERKQQNPVIKYIKDSTPAYLKKPSAKVAFDVVVFSAAALFIIKFGKQIA